VDVFGRLSVGSRQSVDKREASTTPSRLGPYVGWERTERQCEPNRSENVNKTTPRTHECSASASASASNAQVQSRYCGGGQFEQIRAASAAAAELCVCGAGEPVGRRRGACTDEPRSSCTSSSTTTTGTAESSVERPGRRIWVG